MRNTTESTITKRAIRCCEVRESKWAKFTSKRNSDMIKTNRTVKEDKT